MKLAKIGVRQIRHKGFTLVELLIVIIIIGILAGTMMLASFAVTDKARAARICAEIRSMKSAAIFYYNDAGHWPRWIYNGSEYQGEAADYMDRDPVCDCYWLGVVESSTDHRVAVIMDALSLDVGVRKHLAKMAVEMGYYQGTSVHSFPDAASLDYYAEDGDYDKADSLFCFILPK